MEQIREKPFVFFLVLLCFAKISTSTPSHPLPYPQNQTQSPSGKKHFVLIHGAGHGAWCWYKVATLLKYSGRNVTALDLGASGINPIQAEQLPSLSQHVEPLTKLMVSLPPTERVILVAHSMTGAVLSIFMERFPEKIAAAVYATAFMSGPTLSYSTIFAEDLTGLSLVRFSPLCNYDMINLSEEKYGSIRRVFIVSDQDHAIVLDVQNYMIKNNPPDAVKVINGSDHLLMLSRPVELFSHLQNVAEKYS